MSPFPPTPFCHLLPFSLSQQEQRVFPSAAAPTYRPVPSRHAHYTSAPPRSKPTCTWGGMQRDNAMSPRRFPPSRHDPQGGRLWSLCPLVPTTPSNPWEQKGSGQPSPPCLATASLAPPFASPNHLLVPLQQQLPRFHYCSPHCLASLPQTILPLSASWFSLHLLHLFTQVFLSISLRLFSLLSLPRCRFSECSPTLLVSSPTPICIV